MDASYAPALADALEFDEADASVLPWSLDELDRNADLDSLHWAMGRMDGPLA